MFQSHKRCPACAHESWTQVAGPTPDALERYSRYSLDKYGGFIDGWPDTIRLCIMQCTECGHYWYPEVPSRSDLAQMYANARKLNPSAQGSREPSTAMIQRMRTLKRAAPGPRFLDYGSGAGRWSLAASRVGFEVFAYEPHGERVKVSDDGVTQVRGWDELMGGSFDMIMLEQVLEHIPDPHDALCTIRTLCGPQTVLVLRVPNMATECPDGSCWKDWPYDGKHAHVMAPFEHLHGFTRRSLAALSKRSGFSLLPVLNMARSNTAHILRCIAGRFIPRVAPTEVFLRRTMTETHSNDTNP